MPTPNKTLTNYEATPTTGSGTFISGAWPPSGALYTLQACNFMFDLKKKKGSSVFRSSTCLHVKCVFCSLCCDRQRVSSVITDDWLLFIFMSEDMMDEERCGGNSVLIVHILRYVQNGYWRSQTWSGGRFRLHIKGLSQQFLIQFVTHVLIYVCTGTPSCSTDPSVNYNTDIIIIIIKKSK